MSERPLLLSGAKSGVLVTKQHSSAPVVRMFALLAGVSVVLMGAIDIGVRLSHIPIDNTLTFTAFAPAVMLDPFFQYPTYTPAIASTSTAPFVPVRLRVPALGIDAPVVGVGNKEDGSMDTPKKYSDAAWYNLGPKVGAAGSAIFAGHVNNGLMTQGVFFHLAKVEAGDSIEVLGMNGQSQAYVVTEVANYPAEEAPLEAIFTTSGASRIVLITCDGEWNKEQRSFERRIVVFAKIAE